MRTAKVPLIGPLYGYGWLVPLVVIAVRYAISDQSTADLKIQAVGVLVGIICKVCEYVSICVSAAMIRVIHVMCICQG